MLESMAFKIAMKPASCQMSKRGHLHGPPRAGLHLQEGYAERNHPGDELPTANAPES